jgi:CRP-like cAMP-binding protein
MSEPFVDPCAEGICRERLCGRMKRELQFFSFLAEEDLDEVAGYFECRQVPVGKTLWQEGDPCTFVAFVIAGKLEAKKQTEFKGKEVVIAVYSRGAVVGELCLLDATPRAETMVALEHVDLILLTRLSFERLLDERPVLAIRLLKGMLLTVSVRLRKAYERLATIF